MSNSYLPDNDNAYAAWLAHFAQECANNAARLDISPADLNALSDFSAQIAQNLQNVAAARAALRGAVAGKEETLTQSESFVRVLVRRIQVAAGNDDALRAVLGVSVPKKGVRRAPVVPRDLCGEVMSGGRTLLTWNGNGNGRGTVFCVERRLLPAGEWAILAVTGKTRCRDITTPLGTGVSYRVRAFRSDQNSVYTPAIVMHGA